MKKICVICGKSLHRGVKQYCSKECFNEAHYEQYIVRWKLGLENGMRGKFQTSLRIYKYLFDKYKGQCCKCGWHEMNLYTQKIPLEIHHVDGDYTNNKEENLELLCPNCHSLTKTYKNGNANNGRKNRSKLLK